VRDYVGRIRHSIHREPEFGHLPAAPFLAFRRFASLLFRATGVDLPRAKRYDVFLEDAVFDISKARARLNYHPRVTTREAAQRMARWYHEQGLL
jgi:nucleoside-diphosphate-sugar epimerase